MDEFKQIEHVENSSNQGAMWTEAEILLLLESVMKHGDDWELVAQNFQNKSKLDCIAKLIELPFGELMLGSSHRYGNFGGLNGNKNGANQIQLSSSELHESLKTEGQSHEQINEKEQNGDAVDEGPPSKKQCITSLSDAGGSLMKQVGDLHIFLQNLIASIFFGHIIIIFNLAFKLIYRCKVSFIFKFHLCKSA